MVSSFIISFVWDGNVYIYKNYEPNYTELRSSDFCHKTLYLFAFWVTNSLAWVSGVSGEKGKDGSKKGRELKEKNFLSLLPSPLPHLKSPLP